MKRKTKWIALLSSFVLVLAVAAYPIFAWFVQYQKSALFVISDANISVTGWCKVAITDESRNGLLEFDDTKDALTDFDYLNGTEQNSMRLASNQYIAFKFEIKNNSEKDSLVSLRFSPFIDAVFENFPEFYKYVSVNGYSVTNGKNNLAEPLSSSVDTSAKANTAKFGYSIGDRYYWQGADAPVSYPKVADTPPVDPAPVDPLPAEEAPPVDTPVVDNTSLWDYSYGKVIIDDILVEGKTAEGNIKPTYLYFTLVKKQSSIAIDDYKKWLSGHDTEIGYGQERCAALIGSGYTWAALPDADKKIVDQYLSFFIDEELKSISHTEEDLFELNLDIKYFEFSGKSGEPKNT